jgi:hypothetical protein
MAIPQFLQREYGYYQMTGVTNVNTITPQIYNLCANLNNNWTKPDGNNALILRSKPNSAGKYLELSFTENNATTLFMDATNCLRQSAGTGCFVINANGSTVNIFYGDGYCYLETTTGTLEYTGAFVTDIEPCNDQYGKPSSVVTTYRKNAAILDVTNYGTKHFFGRYPISTGATLTGNASASWMYGANSFQDIQGAWLYQPVLVHPGGAGSSGWQGTDDSWSGRLPQTVQSYTQTAGTTWAVPLGDGNTGTFQALYKTPISNECHFMRIA